MDRELMGCPRQPGNLRISRHACALRYLEAQKIGLEIPRREFDIIRQFGLKICRTCPEGKSNATTLQVSSGGHGSSEEHRPVQHGH